MRTLSAGLVEYKGMGMVNTVGMGIPGMGLIQTIEDTMEYNEIGGRRIAPCGAPCFFSPDALSDQE